MKCPYCGRDMILGYIQSSRALVWDTEKLSGVILPSSDGAGRILTKGLFKKQAIESHLCETCNLLISALDE